MIDCEIGYDGRLKIRGIGSEADYALKAWIKDNPECLTLDCFNFEMKPKGRSIDDIVPVDK